MWKPMLIMAVAACADPTLDGSYKGQDPSGNAQFPASWELVIAEAPDSGVTGTYRVTGIGLDNAGSVTGTFADPELALTLTPDDPTKCHYTLTATWSGDEIKGTYMTTQCFVPGGGPLTLTK